METEFEAHVRAVDEISDALGVFLEREQARPGSADRIRENLERTGDPFPVMVFGDLSRATAACGFETFVRFSEAQGARVTAEPDPDNAGRWRLTIERL